MRKKRLITFILIFLTIFYFSSFMISTIQLVLSYIKDNLTSDRCYSGGVKDNSLGNFISIFSHISLKSCYFIITGNLLSIIHNINNLNKKLRLLHKTILLVNLCFSIIFVILTMASVTIVLDTFKDDLQDLFQYIQSATTAYNLNDLSQAPIRFLIYFFITMYFMILSEVRAKR